MERGFLCQKGSKVGRGMIEKKRSMKDKSVEAHGNHSLASANEENMNDAGTVNNVMSNGTTVGPTLAGNAPGMSMSYANVIGEVSRNIVNFHTLITLTRNGVDVVVPRESIRAISEWFVNTAYGFFSGWLTPLLFSSMDGLDAMLNNGPCEDSLSAIATKFADMELKNTIVVAMPKLVREGFYTCTIHVGYEWKPPRCACCKVFGHVKDEYPKNIGSDVAKNLKNPSQTPRGVPVSPKVGFKLIKQVYRPLSIKNNVNISGNKKKDVQSRKEVSNSNPFDVLNSVENDVNLGASSTSTTPIVDKIDKFEKLIIDGKVTLMDDEGKPLKNVDYLGDHDSEDEVALVDNEMASFIASERVGFDTDSLLE
ncbi:hypothetical protein Tco_1230776 [Tanacetum coccineum]